MSYIVIDQGTSSTKAFLFSDRGRILHQKRIKHKLKRPKPFHIECNPKTILDEIVYLFNEMLKKDRSENIHGLGFAFQRSTFLFWEKSSCSPLTPAISWQDSRATVILDKFKKYEKKVWKITGAPLSAHFGGPKFYYMFHNNRNLKQKVKNGDVYFGPLSAFIVHSITGQPAIDESIAGRTLMYDIHKGVWSKFTLDLFGVPIDCLPPIKPVKHKYGNVLNSKIPLLAVIGDQQSALIGQSGLKKNTIGSNFGTSASIQYNVGSEPIVSPGLISSILFSNQKSKFFILEGTINACNSLFHHLEKVLNIPQEKMQWDIRAKGINTEGIYIPGFSGISTPYWKPGFPDIFIDTGKNPNQIIRAGMESIGFLFNDILSCFSESGIELPKAVNASGGAARPVLLQFISSLTNLEICYSDLKDRTAVGVFKILSGGEHNGAKELNSKIRRFKPKYLINKIEKRQKWHKALMDSNLKTSYSEI